jgi:hypothetical protein
MKRILVFAGAGASCAVNKESYPTTQDFFRRLQLIDPSITGDPFFAHCTSFLQAGNPTVDIEQVLWETQKAIEALSIITERESPMGRFIAHDLPGTGYGGRSLSTQIPDAFQATSARLQELRSRINACVFRLYGTIPKPGWLTDNWLRLLSLIDEKGWLIDFATTNYDLVIEEALARSQLKVQTCYVGNPNSVRTLDLELLRTRDPEVRGKLMKLHGSINWQFQDDGSVALSGTNFSGMENRHALIYPGFKGAPRDEPYSTLHDYFSAQLPQYDGAIFIGFGFRDDYLNTLLESRLSEECFVAVLNRSGDVTLPKLRTKRVHRLGHGSGFDGASAKAAVAYMEGVAFASVKGR